MITKEKLGCQEFKKDYNIKYPYVAGAMYKGIGSKEIVVKMGKAGLIAFLGTGGLRLGAIEDNIKYIQAQLPAESYGMNLLNNIVQPELEMQTVELYLKNNIRNVEASAYMSISKPLIYFRFKGAHKDASDNVIIPNQVIAKISRPEVAEQFMKPAPAEMVSDLVKDGKLTVEEASIAAKFPVAYDICVESDSGGHTDAGMPYSQLPGIIYVRDVIMEEYKYPKRIRVGSAGGIGSPSSAAAAFILGADFVLTGSINQCTVEAGNSDIVKDMLQDLGEQDTDYAPAGDMFELGARIQVVKKGTLFSTRANKLYELYKTYNSLDEIDEKVKERIQSQYFKRSFDEVWQETKEYYQKSNPQEIEKAEKNPKSKMALIFRWYFIHTTRMAMQGVAEEKSNFQIHCGPAIGVLNKLLKNTDMENWRNRHVDTLADYIFLGAVEHLNKFYQKYL
jgi:trans-AT polyketide synthase/acyltransferase/oxidoreductase domain-containing protein